MKWLWDLVNATEEGVEWWMFWHPGSGLRGAAIAALVFYCVVTTLAASFHSA